MVHKRKKNENFNNRKNMNQHTHWEIPHVDERVIVGGEIAVRWHWWEDYLLRYNSIGGWSLAWHQQVSLSQETALKKKSYYQSSKEKKKKKKTQSVVASSVSWIAKKINEKSPSFTSQELFFLKKEGCAGALSEDEHPSPKEKENTGCIQNHGQPNTATALIHEDHKPRGQK